MALLAHSLALRPFSQLIPSHFKPGAAGQQRTPSSQLPLKPQNAAPFFERYIRVQSSRRRRRRKAPPLVTVIRAISSTGPFVNDSWGQGAELNAQEKDEVVKEQKKRLIAGVDQTQLLDPHLLMDPDSRFAEYYGVQIHHKIARPGAVPHMDSSSSSTSPSSVASNEAVEKEKERINLPAILLHGFGASLFSWERVMPKLAELLGAPVLAFDRPAFGLTSRTFPCSSSTTAEESKKKKFSNTYSVAYSAAAALAFIDFLQSDQAILIGTSTGDEKIGWSLRLGSTEGELAGLLEVELIWRMLINGEGARHSAGSLVAVEAYVQSPEKIAAMVLVAPALAAPLLMGQFSASTSMKPRKKKSEVDEETKKEKSDPFAKVRAAILWMWVKFTSPFRMLWRIVLLVLNKLLGVLFRSPPAVWLVQRIMDKGGPWAVRYAFHDIMKADKHVLAGYTRPLQCRDWERALLEYCLALINKTDDQGAGKKLQDITCPVLVLTGDTDRIVPDWNSENLVKVFPRGEFMRIKNSGHLPHEETPHEFLMTIKDWLGRTLKKDAYFEEPAMGNT